MNSSSEWSSSSRSGGASAWSTRAESLGVPISLLALLFVAYFRHYSQFGLYGDDHNFIGGTINRDWMSEFRYVWYCLTRWPQGRPLGHGLNLSLLPHLAFKLGGLAGVHLVAFAVLGCNAILLYRLVARVSSAAPAFAAAGFYALSPAHTVQLSLTFAYEFEVAITVSLLAAHAALAGRRTLFAICTAVAFTMYESTAIFALVVPPLLTFRLQQAWRSRTLRHVIIWFTVVFILLGIRHFVGDPWGGERVAEIAGSPLGVLHRGLESAVTGSTTYLSLLVERLLLPLREMDWKLTVIAATCCALALGGFVAAQHVSRASKRAPDTFKPAGSAELAVAGLLMMAATYFTYFRDPWYPASARWGFVSGVHAIPALGASLVLAALIHIGMTHLPSKSRWVALAVPALALGLLGGFGELVQREYATKWKLQLEFWRAYRDQCRDAGARSYVLILDKNLPASRFIDLFSWGTEILPDELFIYPDPPAGVTASSAAWPASLGQRAPMVLFKGPDLAAAISYDGHYHWKYNDYFMLPKSPEQQPDNGNVIVLERRDSTWKRIEGVVPVDGGTLILRAATGDLLDHVQRTRLAGVFGL